MVGMVLADFHVSLGGLLDTNSGYKADTEVAPHSL